MSHSTISTSASYDSFAENAMSHQKRAIICLVIAWFIGTFFFETLTVHGEAVAKRSSSPVAEPIESTTANATGWLVERTMRSYETTQAIAMTELRGLISVSESSKIATRLDKTIAAETAQIVKLHRPKAKIKRVDPPRTVERYVGPFVPDGLSVDPVVEVMPVATWVTRMAYRQLSQSQKPLGIHELTRHRIAFDMARESAIPGLMRLAVDRRASQLLIMSEYKRKQYSHTKAQPVSVRWNGSKSKPAVKNASQIRQLSAAEEEATVDMVRFIGATVPQKSEAKLSVRPVAAAYSIAKNKTDYNSFRKSQTDLVATVAEPVTSFVSNPTATTPAMSAAEAVASQSVVISESFAPTQQTASPRTAVPQIIAQQTPAVEIMAQQIQAQQTPAQQTPLHQTQLPQATQQQTVLQGSMAASESAPAVQTQPQLGFALPAPVQTQGQSLNQPSALSTLQSSVPARMLDTRVSQRPFGNQRVSSNEPTVSLNVENVDVKSVFEMLARGYGMDILVSPDVEGVVTANVEGLTPDQTLRGVMKMCNLRAQVDQGVIYVYPASKMPDDARVVRHFPLDFARAEMIEPAIQGMLSPIGNAYINKLDATDNLKTLEAIVVIDTLDSIARIENYILQVDQAPRQVMIEARILEIELTDDITHGVNFDSVLRGDLTVGGFGFAGAPASVSNPLFFAQIAGSRVQALVDLLETTTDAKTLATPKIMVVNGQNARIQVGQQLGFTVATVTQTSTIQDVQFLDTGVVLSVTPTISRDGKIMMEVKPEVSSGQINPTTLLPEETTRELETSVLLNNHQGMVIGGLIQDNDRTVIRKLPWLGDVKHVGKLFQRRSEIRSRSEIVVALIPHIIEVDDQYHREPLDEERLQMDFERTSNPLLRGPLKRTCRPWEARLPDAFRESSHLDVNRLNRMIP